MADSSILTLGTARSLLVDSSVCDSRIAETTKDHVFLGMGCDDEGQSARDRPPFLEEFLNIRNKPLLVFKKKSCRYTLCDVTFQHGLKPFCVSRKELWLIQTAQIHQCYIFQNTVKKKGNKT